MNYLNDQWKSTLETMGMQSFDDWWQLDAKAAEAPNTKAGDLAAWSKVSVIKAPNGKTIYVKRQQNFYPNNLLQKWRKELTFEREYVNYQKIRAAGIPTYELVYFASRKQDGYRQAVYVAEGLEGLVSLENIDRHWQKNGWPPKEDRRKLLRRVLQTVQEMHQKGILHNALSPRHLFFNLSPDRPYEIPDEIDFRLIDFERLKDRKPNSDKGVTRDLFTLYRRGANWPNSDRIWFLKQYLGIDKLDARAKAIIHRFIREAERRRRR